jgi:hypothetical protein
MAVTPYHSRHKLDIAWFGWLDDRPSAPINQGLMFVSFWIWFMNVQSSMMLRILFEKRSKRAVTENQQQIPEYQEYLFFVGLRPAQSRIDG